MPVWHALTKGWRASGDLVVLGIAKEQHPDRCQLFAQWQGFDWPILWDPFNLSGTTVVPVLTFVDEHGVIRGRRIHPDRFEEEYLRTAFEHPGPRPEGEPLLARADLDAAQSPRRPLARLLWGGPAALDEAIDELEKRVAGPEPDPTTLFQLGVALRLRYDSRTDRPADFQASIDRWTEALIAAPEQYIWRRRIQQYGPRLDKPYPFYDWVSTAQDELRACGTEPVGLRVPLTDAELAGPSNVLPVRIEDRPAPDPRRKVPIDEDGRVSVEGAAALHTGAVAGMRVRARPTARIHVALRPDTARDVHWTNDAGPALVWIAVPSGWQIEHNLYELPVPASETSSEVRRLDFEVVPPQEHSGPARVLGYALYYVCEGEAGTCIYLRQDFQVEIPIPAGSDR